MLTVESWVERNRLVAKKKGPLERRDVKEMLDKVQLSSEDALVDRVWGLVCHRPRVSIPAIPFLRKAIEKVELVLQSLDPWIEKGKKKRSSDSLTTLRANCLSSSRVTLANRFSLPFLLFSSGIILAKRFFLFFLPSALSPDNQSKTKLHV